MELNDPRHGTRPGYYAHRKAGQPACGPCKRAAAKAEQIRQLHLMRGEPGRLDATGTRRRLQALVALGWNWKALGQHIGSDEVLVKRWAERDEPGAYVYRDTAERVAATFERLCMTFPPTETPGQRNAAARARNRARRNGWLPPLAWNDIDDPDEQPQPAHDVRHPDDLDPAVVELLTSGVRTPSTRAEKEAAMSRWLATGRDERALCSIHGWRPGRYVVRHEEAS